MPDSYKEQMQALQQLIGKEVYIEFVFHGEKLEENVVLLRVYPFLAVDVHSKEVGGECGNPLIGDHWAVQKISHEGRVVYHNPEILDNYDLHDKSQINELRKRCFGLDAKLIKC